MFPFHNWAFQEGLLHAENLGGAGHFLAADIGEKTNVAEKEPAKFKELAAAWDKWNSELIDPKWFPYRPGAAKKAGKRNPDRAALFVRMDKNHDGKLSFEEFMANRPDPEGAKRLFEQWDSGKKGFLTRDEFITMGGKVK